MSFMNGANDWLSLKQLTAACTLRTQGMIGPHPDQSVQCIRNLIRTWATEPVWPLGSSADNGLILLAVDSLSYDLALELLTSDELICLTSTFPSTSTVSWVSSVTGSGCSENRVSGPVGLQPGVDGVYNILRSCAYTWDDGKVVSSPALPEAFPAQPTAFDDLVAAGLESSVLVGDFTNVCSQWTGLLVGGGRRIEPSIDVAGIRSDGRRVASAVVQQVDEERATAARQCIWAYVNLDEHAHRYGYDADFRAAVRSLSDAAERWSELGHTVILHSDHGQVPNRVTPADVARFDAVTSAQRCRLPPGGAGRVRWIYPVAGQEATLLAALRDLLGDDAIVCHRDELVDLGLTALNGLPGCGEIMTIATGAAFPVPDPAYVFEHGSLTPGEMLVPLAVWGPR